MAEQRKQRKMIAFRLSDSQLEQRIKDFREKYSDGSKGIVTWPRFCTFLGYSLEEVSECYMLGKSEKNIYSIRAEMLERFYTEVQALTNETSDKKQSLAREENKKNYLNPAQEEDRSTAVHVLFGCHGDDKWIEAMK